MQPDDLVARFDAALRGQDWASALATGIELVQARPDDARVYQLTSHALSKLGRPDDALAWAQRGLTCTYSEGLVVRLIVALSAVGRVAEVVAVWQRYKERFEPGAVDPHIPANALAGYAARNDHAAGIAELEPWVQANRRGEDRGLLDFNAACLYAVLGRLDESLRRAGRALERGWPRESLARDADLAPLRQHPGYATLLALHQQRRVARTWRRADGGLTTLVVDLTQLSRRRYPPAAGGGQPVAEVSESEHRSRADAALALVAAEEALRAAGGQPAPSPELEFWRGELVRVVEALGRAQADGAAPGGIGALVWEWDFGESSAERAMWFGAFGWDDLAAARERFSSYAFGDGLLWDDARAGPPLDTPAQLEELAAHLARSAAFVALDRKTPFFLVHQEHDSGLEHAVVLGAADDP